MARRSRRRGRRTGSQRRASQKKKRAARSPSRSPSKKKATKKKKKPMGRSVSKRKQQAKKKVNKAPSKAPSTKKKKKPMGRSYAKRKQDAQRVAKKLAKTPTPKAKLKRISKTERQNVQRFGQEKVNQLKKQFSDFKVARKEGTLHQHRAKLISQGRKDIKLSAIDRSKLRRDARLTASKFTRPEGLTTAAERNKHIISKLTDPNYKGPYSPIGIPSVGYGDKYGMQNAELGIASGAFAVGKGVYDSYVGLGGWVPGKIGEQTDNYLKSSQFKDPRLQRISDIAGFAAPGIAVAKGLNLAGKVKKGVQGLNALRGVKGLQGARGLKTVFHGTSTDAARKITQGALQGVGKGFREQLGMLGKGAYSSVKRNVAGSYLGAGAFKGTPFGAKQGRILKAVVPQGARTLRGATVTSGKQLDRGLRIAKGVSDGTYTGAKAQQIASLMKGAPKTNLTALGQLGRVAGAGVTAAAVGRLAGTGIGNAVPGKAWAGTADAILRQDIVQKLLANQSAEEGEELNPAAQYVSNQILRRTEGFRDTIDDQPGIKGMLGRRATNIFEKSMGRGDFTRASKVITGNMDLARRYGGDFPTVGQWARGKWGQGWDMFRGQEPRTVRQILSPSDDVRGLNNLISSGRGSRINTDVVNTLTRSRGRSVIQDTDINKIAGQTENEYLQSGSAAQDEDRLIDFWKRQERLNADAEQRLKDIESDRSIYNNLLASIDRENQSYQKELDRLKPIGQGYQDELARIQPIGQSYQDELARLQPFGKQYSDELTRLQPYDKEFTTSLADLVKGRDELRGWQGQDLHPDDAAFLKTELPEYDKSIADLEKQYEEYKSSISTLKSDQKDYQNLLSSVKTDISDYQSYLGEVKSGQKEYQDYLGSIQSGQKELGVYRSDVSTQQKGLEDYFQAFSAAKQASDQAARSYTVQSQQGIDTGLRQGIAGVRAAGGFRTIGRARNKSAKRRFNRDFRLTSFGNTGQFPINL